MGPTGVTYMMINIVSVGLSDMKYYLCRLVVLLLLMMSASASAAQLTVRIFERGGKAPLQDVAVCLGTSARLTQFGASLTNTQGYVTFADVPRTQLLITASRPGYMGEQERMAGSGENRMLVLSMSKGGGGVQCPLNRDVVARRAAGLEIESFLLNAGAVVTENTLVTLDNKITGQATQYRASERSDLLDADWQAYERQPRFRVSAGQGNKTIYFQVRRHKVINGAAIETRSSIMHDSISIQFQQPAETYPVQSQPRLTRER